MTIYVTGTGNLKKYVPESNKVDLPEGSTLKDLRLVLKLDNSVKLGFTVNGKMARLNQVLSNMDKIVLIMLVSAG